MTITARIEYGTKTTVKNHRGILPEDIPAAKNTISRNAPIGSTITFTIK